MRSIAFSFRGDVVSSMSRHPLEDVGSIPALRSNPELYLEFCSAGDPRYKEILKHHYIWAGETIKGIQGQQVHFLVWYKEKIVGVISGASAVYLTAPRDKFFGLSGRRAAKDAPATGNREKCLNGIVDNVVFRLHDHEKNLASRVLSLWEKSVVWVWENLYGVKVFGFETFILFNGSMIQEEVPGEFDSRGRPILRVVRIEDHDIIRPGGIYRAVGWSLAGETFGSAKGHDGVGLTGGKNYHEKLPQQVYEDLVELGVLEASESNLINDPFRRRAVPPKDVYCKWVPGYSAPVESDYLSSWKASTEKGTPEEKSLAKWRTDFRRSLLGARFSRDGKALVYENIKQATCGRFEWNAPGAPDDTRRRKMRQSTRSPAELENLRETKAN